MLYLPGIMRCCIYLELWDVISSWNYEMLYPPGVMRCCIYLELWVVVSTWNYEMLYLPVIMRCCIYLELWDVISTWNYEMLYLPAKLDKLKVFDRQLPLTRPVLRSSRCPTDPWNRLIKSGKRFKNMFETAHWICPAEGKYKIKVVRKTIMRSFTIIYMETRSSFFLGIWA